MKLIGCSVWTLRRKLIRFWLSSPGAPHIVVLGSHDFEGGQIAASLVDPVKVEVSNKFSVPKQLIQQYCFIPAKWKDVYFGLHPG